MDLKNKNTFCLAAVLFAIAVISPIAFCRGSPDTKKLGGMRNVVRNDGDVESIAVFAVQQYNKNENALLKFVRVVKASEQVVAGKNYYLTLEAVDGEEKKTYEAKVWVKPWENFKELQEFNQTSFTSWDLGADHGRGEVQFGL